MAERGAAASLRARSQPDRARMGSVKSRQLDNLCSDSIAEVAGVAEAGLDRVANDAPLCLAFCVTVVYGYDWSTQLAISASVHTGADLGCCDLRGLLVKGTCEAQIAASVTVSKKCQVATAMVKWVTRSSMRSTRSQTTGSITGSS
jgi:hypothetical protein